MAAVNFLTLFSYIYTLGIPIYDLDTEIECSFTQDNLVGVGRTMNVYKACFKKDYKIKLAAKVPYQLLLHTPDYKIYEILGSLCQEIRIMKHLADHPNIIDFYGMSFNELNPVVFVEFSIGSVQHYLEDKKEEGRPVDWPTKAAFCYDVADGLHALHAVGVVHGDIKADNVLLFPISEDDSVDKLFAKIANFGYSATTASIGLGRGTGGTRNFCAPECTRVAPYEIRRYKDNAKKDNYMFGLFVWQVSKDGEIPYDGLEDIDIEKIKHEDKDLNMLLSQLPSDIPEEFQSVISKTTHYRPTDRIALSNSRRILAKMLDSDATTFREVHSEIKEIFSSNATELPEISKAEISSIKSMKIPSTVKRKIYNDFKEAAKKSKTDSERNADAISVEIARQNYADAAFSLSICYEEEFGVKLDMDKTVEWLIKAADNGSLEAMTKLVDKYNIKELPADPDIVFLLYIKAAHAGSLIAQFKVSICYYLGFGVGKDIVKGDFWISKCGLAGLVNTLEAMGIYDNDKNLPINTTLSFLLKLCDDIDAMSGYANEYTRNNHIDTTKVLMADFGTNIVAMEKYNPISLHEAVLNEHIGIVKYLVNVLGMDVNTKDNGGSTPLHEAALNGNINMAKLLVAELGADVNIKDNNGLSPMHKAALNGNINMAKLLVAELGADVNTKDNKGSTPLHEATLNGNIRIARFLVTQLGADVSIKDNIGLAVLYKVLHVIGGIGMGKLLVVEFIIGIIVTIFVLGIFIHLYSRDHYY